MSILLLLEPFIVATKSFFADIWLRWGIAGILVIVLILIWGGTVIHYEGVPFLRGVWLVDKIPGVGPILEGKIKVKVDEAVASAKHEFAIEAAAITAAAKLTAESEYEAKVAIVTSGFKTLLAKAQASATETTDDLEHALSENAALRKKNGVPSAPPLDDGTAAILSRQGFRVHK